jgi:hypothetical protein
MPASEAVGRRHGRYLDPVGVTLPSSQAETAAEAGADHRPAKITDAPLNRSREALLVARRSTSPMGPVGRCTDISSDSEVATADSTRVCSSCLMGLHLGKWSPRSDSNRRPSDYESKRIRPAGTSPVRSRCSRQPGRPASAFLTCPVTAGGMTKRMTRPPQAPSYVGWQVVDAALARRHRGARPTPGSAPCHGFLVAVPSSVMVASPPRGWCAARPVGGCRGGAGASLGSHRTRT